MVAGSGADVAHPQGFDVLRIVAACMVVVSHAYLLPAGPHGPQPDLFVFGDFAFNLGRVGVIIFFIVSGYLICASWLNDPRPQAFAEKRARRLLPALATMLVLVTFVVGPLMTDEAGYLTDPGTYEYFLRNLLIFPYDYHLPGVFTDNPTPLVNGVLWTLGVEVFAYSLLAVAGFFGLLGGPRRLALITLVLALVGWRLPAEAVAGGALVPVALRVELVAYFFAAATVRVSGWRPTAASAAVAAAVVTVLVLLQAPLSIALVPTGTIVVLYLGTRAWPAARKVTRFGDPSYGAYIYGYVVQQLMIALLGMAEAPLWVFATTSVIVCLGIGYASWHTVEKRALRRSRPRAPEEVAAPVRRPPW